MHFYIEKILFSNNNYPEIDNIQYFTDLTNVPIETDIFVFGSIETLFKIDRPIRPVAFWNLSVSEYLSNMQNYCINYKNSYFKQVCQLNDKDIGCFIKSNSGYKVLTGDILTKHHLNWIVNNLSPDELLFLAPKQNIQDEYRFWIINDEIITYSYYAWDKNIQQKDVPNKVIDFVYNVKDIWSPDNNYTMDVCTYKDRNDNNIKIGIVEYNCLPSSGFYNADISKILKTLEDIQSI